MKISKLFLLVASLVLCAFATQRGQAAMIQGAITFAGGVDFDTDSLATATRVNAFSNVVVVSDDGDYAGFVNPGDSVTMATPWIFTPSTQTPGLWSVGGFAFDLDTSTVVLQNANFLLIEGSGIIEGNGFDATAGIFRFSTQSPGTDNGIFSFSASSRGVPDGGATVALLGIALLGLEVIRRRVVLS
jgi:hypothetical protein